MPGTLLRIAVSITVDADLRIDRARRPGGVDIGNLGHRQSFVLVGSRGR